jgi:hypothetical protein
LSNAKVCIQNKENILSWIKVVPRILKIILNPIIFDFRIFEYHENWLSEECQGIQYVYLVNIKSALLTHVKVIIDQNANINERNIKP